MREHFVQTAGNGFKKKRKTLKTNEKIKSGLSPSFVGGDFLADFHGIVDVCQNVKNLL